MKPKSFILFALAAGCGLVAMMGVKQVMSSNQEGDDNEEMVKVLFARSDIPSHIPLNEANVEFREMKKSAVQFGAVTSIEEYDGRALRTSAVKDEPIMKAKLSEKGAFDASNQIPKGMRLVSVPVNLTTSHSGLVRPGDRVDILVTYDASGAATKSVTTTRTVLEFIEVFAIDSLVSGNDPNQHDILAKNVSLLVTPQQAQLLMLAQKEGAFHLALRPKDDDQYVQLAPVNEIDDLQRGSAVQSEREKQLEAELASKDGDLSASQEELASLRAEMEKLRNGELNEQNEQPSVPKKTWQVTIFANSVETKSEFELDESEADDNEAI